MGLPKIGSTTWQEEIESVASQFRKAVISVYDPTNLTGGKPTAVISRRRARVQMLRSPAVATDSSQQIAKRPFQFETELLAGDPVIQKDHIIRIHSVESKGSIPGDPALLTFVFTVTDGVNSSEAALRTINTLSELKPVAVIP